MKKLLLWVLFFVFLYLAITAGTMHEWVIALVLGAIAVGCAWAAPTNSSSKSSLWAD
jgi:cytochrome b